MDSKYVFGRIRGYQMASPGGREHQEEWLLLNKVSNLMDPITGGWDSQLIKDVFCEEDAALILSIPTRPDHEDFVAWHFDPKGKFSVKSAYHVLVDDEERERLGKQVNLLQARPRQMTSSFGRKFGGSMFAQRRSNSFGEWRITAWR